MEQAQKRGLSKGCLVGLIIIGILVVIIVIGAITCYVYRADLTKKAGSTALVGVKDMVAENPPEGVDTVQFNALTDAFLTQLDQDDFGDDDTKMQRFGMFLQKVTSLMGDGEVSAEDVKAVSEAMVDFYPSLEEEFPLEEAVDSLMMMTDSTLSQ